MRIGDLLKVGAAALLLAACDEATGPREPRADEVRASVTLGAGQEGTAGRALRDSVVVRVTGAGGAPAAGVALEWRVLDTPGGEVLSATTRTGRDGSSGNVWVLGPRAGTQRLEVRAALSGGPVVLDTVEAVAHPGEAVALRIVGDTIRELVVGDTARLSVRGEDRFGNEVPAARLGARWSSLHPGVASVDSAGAARALALGSALVEARAGAARARAQLRVNGVLESFVVEPKSRAYVSGFVHHAGRILALSTTTYRTAVYHTAWELVDGAWRAQAVGPGYQGRPAAHVTPTGTAYAKADFLFVSPRPGSWGQDSSAVSRWARMAGVGGTLFGLRPTGYNWQPYTWKAERWEGGAVTELGLPAPYDQKTEADAQLSLAAAGREELYVAGVWGTVHWNGSAWAAVARPDGGGVLPLRSLAAPPEGGIVLGVLGRNLLYRLGGGRAERVAHPLERTGETVRGVSVNGAGDPLLVAEDGVHFRVAGEWREQRAPEGFRVQAAGWGGPGVVWMAVTRPTGEMDYYGSIHELRFQRLTVRR